MTSNTQSGASSNGFSRTCRYQPNQDESTYSTFIGNFHKGLPHNEFGEVDVQAYELLLRAIREPTREHVDAIVLGRGRKLANLPASFSDDVQGPSPRALRTCAAPPIASAEVAAEMIELYWMALLRDVPLVDLGDCDLARQAAQELSSLEEFFGPRNRHGLVDVDTLFRGSTPGDRVGPMISQFLWQDARFGTQRLGGLQLSAVPDRDYMTSVAEWLDIQDGGAPVASVEFDAMPRYIRSMRDLAHYVHFDQLYQAGLNACLLLLELGAPADAGNPYHESRTQAGFVTYGPPNVLSMVCEVATRALKAVWWQKWCVHRRVRPEAFAGMVHFLKSGQRKTCDYPLDETLMSSAAAERIQLRFGSYLLPMAYPEGSPMHPSFGAGHGAVAGACVTMLKAWFEETWQLPRTVMANRDGTKLMEWKGEPLNVGSELNKLAANIAVGRNVAGVHWRSDYIESVKLGEAVAICVLAQQSTMCLEQGSFSLTKFDGTAITIRDGRVFDAQGMPLPVPGQTA